MKCARPKCEYVAKARGLCEKHYDNSPKGFVPSGPVVDHYNKLRGAGLSCTRIAELSGVNRDTLRRMGKWTAGSGVQLSTATRVLAVPVPHRPIDGGGRVVNAVGTRRRIQALVAIGWPLHTLADKLGCSYSALWQHTRVDSVVASTAASVDALYLQLHLTRGPSERSRRRALRQGWVPPLAWDCIDDPDEQPDLGADSKLSFPERYLELREHVGLNHQQIADVMGIELDSLERQLHRYDMYKGRAA